MDINEWEIWYKNILNDFGFSREGDEKTADVLNDILDKKGCFDIDDLYDYVTKKTLSKNFIVFGAGPSLKSNISQIKKDYNLNDYILISADGATTALLEEDIIPDIIVTDLDGKISDLLIANASFDQVHIRQHQDRQPVRKPAPFAHACGQERQEGHHRLPAGRVEELGVIRKHKEGK